MNNNTISPTMPETLQSLCPQSISAQFPALHQTVHGKPLVYLDNAATTQKPQAVLDALVHYYQKNNANVYRAVHTLSGNATQALESTRTHLSRFINAASPSEIIFTAGTTASINLVAATYGRQAVQSGDEIIISHMEHHANIVPWQMLCEERGATLKVIPVSQIGQLSLDTLAQLLTPKTKIVAIGYVSNTLGTINPIRKITQMAHAQGAIVVVDAAQALPHIPIDVQDLGCDFLACSAHKAYGPTGVGLLYGKQALLEAMPPYQGGGEMIQNVTLEKTTYNEAPYKFEAGTPPIGSIIAWQAALQFIESIGYDQLRVHEDALLAYGTELLSNIPKIKLIGEAPNKVGVLSFIVEGMHHFDLALMLDAQGIAVRAGHSCAQPLMEFLGIDGIVRASIAVYNSKEDMLTLASALEKIIH